MLFIQLGILTLICFVCYQNFKDILSPTFITSAIFALSTFIALINYSNWGVSYSLRTLFLILGSVISMYVGEQIARTPKYTKKISLNNSKYTHSDLSFISIKKTKEIVLVSFCLIYLLFSIRNTIQLAYAAGYTGGANLLKYARWGSHSLANHASYLTLMKYFVTGCGFSYIYILINNYIYSGDFKRLRKSSIIIIFVFILDIFLSTSRADFILLFQVGIFLFVITWRFKKKTNRISFYKYAIWMFAVLIGFFILFQFLGTFTGKTGLYDTIEMISIYSGSSIPALEVFVSSTFDGNYTGGKETFWGFISFLNRFGFNLETTSLTKEFIEFSNGSSTNIYTSLRHYYSDFGMTGTFFLYILQGFILTRWYLRIMRGESFNVKTLLYSYFAYTLVRQITAAEFLSVYFSLYHIFTVVGIVVAFKFINPKRRGIDYERYNISGRVWNKTPSLD